VEIVFSGQNGLGVEIVSISGDLHVLVDPVSVLLQHVSVELVNHEAGGLPPGVGNEADPAHHTSHSHPTEVLVELSFVDLSDTETTHWDQSTPDTLGSKEKD